jgi:flagellar protein FlaG
MSSDKLAVNAATPKSPGATLQKNGAAPASVAAAQPEAQSEPKMSVAEIGAVARKIESYLKSVNRALEFEVDSASGRTVVTVRDAENGEVIRQIPNEEVLRFAQLAEEQTIVLLNETI